MCMAPHAETRPPPPIPPFLLAQNLSSKRIVPTDNVAKVRQHQMASSVVKGLIYGHGSYKGAGCSLIDIVTYELKSSSFIYTCGHDH